MHKARHTAGQRVLDVTGNLKAVQKLLGHESIQTTGDIYTDSDMSSSRRHCWRPSRLVRQSFPRALDKIPASGQIMEAAGIEPASAVAPNRASTSVVRACISPAGRFTDDPPTGQPSFVVTPQAIGSPLVPSPIVGAGSQASGRTRVDVALPSFD